MPGPTIISAPIEFRTLTLPFRYKCNLKIILESKFQPYWTSGYGDIAIFFKIWPKFGPSLGTNGPIPKKFLRCNLPYCAGSVSKFQPPSFKTVAVVWQGRTFLASPLYMYRWYRRNYCKDFRSCSWTKWCLCFCCNYIILGKGSIGLGVNHLVGT